MTAIIIGANILVFIAMVISGVNILGPGSETLLKWGADFRPSVLEGQWWRLLTCCFLHIGIIHLLVNMYALLYIGVLLEPFLGRLKFTLAYFLTGILSSLSSIVWNEATVSAGASGAIFGVYGLFLALLTTQLIHPAVRKPMLKSMVWFVILNLSIGFSGLVDNAGHVGGLVSGLLMGYAYYPSLKNPWASRLKYVVTILPAMAVLIITFFTIRVLPNNIGIYEQQMKVFASRDSLAIDAIARCKDYPKGQQRDSLKAKGINYWEQNIQLVSDIDKHRLPAAFHERNIKLILYCRTRISYAVLAVKALDENTPVYNDKIEETTRQLNALVKELEE